MITLSDTSEIMLAKAIARASVSQKGGVKKGIPFLSELQKAMKAGSIGLPYSPSFTLPVREFSVPFSAVQETVPASISTDDESFKTAIDIVLKNEGSKVVRRDGGKSESSKFGILESTAKKFCFTGKIENMTITEAKQIYKKLWDKSGAGKLSLALAIVHFDTYVNSPSAANKMLAMSKGDTDKYLEIRSQRYDRLVAKNPVRFAKYEKGWANRISALKTTVNTHKGIV